MYGKVMKALIVNALSAYLDVDALMIKRIKMRPLSEKDGITELIGKYKTLEDKARGKQLTPAEIAQSHRLAEAIGRLQERGASTGLHFCAMDDSRPAFKGDKPGKKTQTEEEAFAARHKEWLATKAAELAKGKLGTLEMHVPNGVYNVFSFWTEKYAAEVLTMKGKKPTCEKWLEDNYNIIFRPYVRDEDEDVRDEAGDIIVQIKPVQDSGLIVGHKHFRTITGALEQWQKWLEENEKTSEADEKAEKRYIRYSPNLQAIRVQFNVCKSSLTNHFRRLNRNTTRTEDVPEEDETKRTPKVTESKGTPSGRDADGTGLSQAATGWADVVSTFYNSEWLYTGILEDDVDVLEEDETTGNLIKNLPVGVTSKGTPKVTEQKMQL